MRYVYNLVIDTDKDPEPLLWDALNERFLAGADHISLRLKDFYHFSHEPVKAPEATVGDKVEELVNDAKSRGYF